MKGILLIIDGLGDLPVPALGGRTPLEAAHTPVLNRLAANGRVGLIDPIRPGETPNTHSGVGELLGLAPGQAEQLKRGPVEAAGLGMDLVPGDIAFRTNFATLTNGADGLEVLDRRAGRINEGTAELAAFFGHVELGDGVTATLKPTEQHRGVLLLKGPGLDERVSDTDPGDHEMPARLRECRATGAGAEFTAALVNRFVRIAHTYLDRHPVNQGRKAGGLLPANGIITRGAGAALAVGNVVVESGLRASVVSGCNTVRGLAKLFGFEVVHDQRFTGGLDTDLEAKISAVVAQLEDHDLVFIHIKAPDICAHDLRPLAKRDFLQKIDCALAPLEQLGVQIAVTADHTTDSNTGFHTADPVPTLVYVPGQGTRGAAVNFGESMCREGSLPRQTSHQLMLEFTSRLQ